jgi:hypothetical protein
MKKLRYIFATAVSALATLAATNASAHLNASGLSSDRNSGKSEDGGRIRVSETAKVKIGEQAVNRSSRLKQLKTQNQTGAQQVLKPGVIRSETPAHFGDIFKDKGNFKEANWNDAHKDKTIGNTKINVLQTYQKNKSLGAKAIGAKAIDAKGAQQNKVLQQNLQKQIGR